ncbi:hypothetical protein WDW37_08790 [Bdellovibrionota bacterium FG-1]
MIRGLKFAGSALLGVLAITLLLLIAGGFYLGSASGSKRILSFAREKLAHEWGIQTEYQEGRFSIFSGFHFENLHIYSLKGAHQPIDVFVKTIEVGYSFALFSKSLRIDRVRVSHPTVQTSVAKTGGGKSEGPKSEGMEGVRKLLAHPPLSVTLKEFVVEDLSLDLNYRDEGSEVTARVKHLNLNTAFEMQAGRFLSTGSVEWGDSSQVRFMSKQGSGRLEVEAFPYAHAKWVASLHQQEGQWFYEVQPSEFQWGLKKLSLTQEGQGASVRAQVEGMHWVSKAKLLARSAEVLRAESQSVQSFELKNTLQLGKTRIEQVQGVKQTRLEFVSQKMTIDGALTQAQAKNIDFNLDWTISHLVSKGIFLKPAQLEVKAMASLPQDLGSIKGKAAVELNQVHLLALDFGAQMGSKLRFEGNLKPSLDPRLAGILAQAAVLKEIAPASAALSAALDWDFAQSQAAVNATVDLQNPKIGKWQVKSQFDLKTANQNLSTHGTTVVSSSSPGSLVSSVTLAPLTFTHQVQLDHGRLEADLAADLPSLEVSKIAKVADCHLKASVHSPQIELAKDLDVSFEWTQGAITLAKEVTTRASHVSSLGGLQLAMKASVRDGERLTLEKFSGDFNHGMIQVSAHATGRVQLKDLQTQGSFVFQVPKDFPEIEGKKIRGRIEFPWTLSVLQGREINFEGDLNLRDLGFATVNQRISGISGSVPVQEKLLWDGKGIKFAYLITQNPFERVDYERLRPLIEGVSQVRAEEIGFEEKTYGPLTGYFSIRQNMIFAHRFDLSLGTSGRAYGEMYFDVLPANLQLGFLSRLTSLNLQEILPQKYLVRAPKGVKNVSLRSGLVFNLNQQSVDGRLDITEIGGAQLITLINVLDPKYENEKMNTLRSALGVGYPTFVALAFQKGYMDMSVELAVLGISKGVEVRGIPLSGFVSSATADFVKKTEEVPLK